MSVFSRTSVWAICAFALSNPLIAATQRYHLNIAEQPVMVAGQRYERITVNGQFPAPTLEFTEGDVAEIHVHNALTKDATAIHWHGILLPGIMDGVHALNQFQAIQTGQDFVYRFPIRQSGTYWYHAHAKGQEQDGLYGAIVIHPQSSTKTKAVAPSLAQSTTSTTTSVTTSPTMAFATATSSIRSVLPSAAVDEVLMLSDFHAEKSASIVRHLKQSGEYYQRVRQTVPDVLRQVRHQGWRATWQDRKMWNQMRMSPTDLADVSGYSYLINGHSQHAPWQRPFQPQQVLKLRIINAAAMTFFDFRIPTLRLKVIAADGQAVQPVEVDELRIGPSETYDVLLMPQAQDYQVQAEALDRSGFALGYLRNNPMVHHASVPMDFAAPQPRPRALLTHQDMMMQELMPQNTDTPYMQAQHSVGSHRDTAIAQRNDDLQHHSQHNLSQPDHSQDNDSKSSDSQNNASQQNHAQNSQAQRGHLPQRSPQEPHAKASTQATQPMQMDHAAMAHATAALPNNMQSAQGWADASTPKGQRALAYSDLIALNPQPDTRPASRSIDIHLNGNMQRYIWTLNGQTQAQAQPIYLRYGERVRLNFINDSMMAHPMHLHGMFMQLDNGQPAAQMPNKHTVIVPPATRVSVLVSANELGEWMLHCHLLYHMMTGMMNTVVVARDAEQESEQVLTEAQTLSKGQTSQKTQQPFASTPQPSPSIAALETGDAQHAHH